MSLHEAPTDQRTPYGQEGLMDLGQPLIPDAQPAAMGNAVGQLPPTPEAIKASSHHPSEECRAVLPEPRTNEPKRDGTQYLPSTTLRKTRTDASGECMGAAILGDLPPHGGTG
jgi:hypothetical protein